MNEKAFLKAIAEGDDTARLAFADWLEDRGDLRAAWVRDPKIFAWMLPDGRDPVPVLIEALRNRYWELREDIIEAFRRVGSHAAPALVELLPGEDDAARYAAEVLAFMGPEAVTPLVPRLTEMIRNRPEDDSSTLAVWAIAGAGAAAVGVVPDLIARLKANRDGDSADSYTAATLGAIGPAAIDAVPALVGQFHFPENDPAMALVKIGPTATRTLLREAAKLDSDWMIRAVYPLRCYGAAVVDELRTALTDENIAVRHLAALALAPLDGEAATPILVGLLSEEWYPEAFRTSVLESLELAAASAPAMVPQIRHALQTCSPNYAPPWYPDQIEHVLNSLDRSPDEQVIAALSTTEWWRQRNTLLALDNKPTPPPAIFAAIVPLLLAEPEVQRLAHGILARAKRLSRPALVAALHARCDPDKLHYVVAWLRSTDLPPLPKVLREAIESLAS